MRPDWFSPHLAYTISKYGMSMVMLGMANEFLTDGIACNALWPRTTIATSAVEFALGGVAMMKNSRHPAIMADAAHAILCRPARDYSGHFVLDEDVLREEGIRSFDHYSCDPAESLELDLFVDENTVLK
jgi:citronellol/citronellal dehydrogenase